jgi:hypothetical protein
LKLSNCKRRGGQPKEAIPAINRSVTDMAEEHSHHCRMSMRRTMAFICFPGAATAEFVGLFSSMYFVE